MARTPLLALALGLALRPAAAQLSCLTRVTHVHYESVAAIDMVEFFYRDDSSALYDTDNSGAADHEYAQHGRVVIPCDRYISSVAWTDFGTHGWMGREIDYSLADSSGSVVETLEQAAGYAPDCLSDDWAQTSMGGCLPPAVFNAPAGEAIVGLVFSADGRLTGITSEPLPPLDQNAPLRSESTPIGMSRFVLGGNAQLVDGAAAGDTISLTSAQPNQAGTAFFPLWSHGSTGSEDITARFEMYIGDGTGADGMCVNIGGNSLYDPATGTERYGEDGVSQGVAVCFDEYSNGGDHGVSIFYDGATVWEELGQCGNQEACEPISLFADAAWHAVEVNVSPTANGGAVVTFQLTTSATRSGNPRLFHGFATIPDFSLTTPAYLGFTARTGGATNNHWVRGVTRETVWTTPQLPLPAPPLPVELAPAALTLSGSAVVSGDVIRLTTAEVAQTTGEAYYSVGNIESQNPGGFEFKASFEMYVGGGTGADGMCVSVGNNDLSLTPSGSRWGENGVTEGVAICFDEYDNDPDIDGAHGIKIKYNGDTIWQQTAPCGNRQGCEPVSLFEDSRWHKVELKLALRDREWAAVPHDPSHGLYMRIEFDFDDGLFGGIANVAPPGADSYSGANILPHPCYLGFTARVGGLTDNHWVRRIATSRSPPPPLPTQIPIADFVLSGNGGPNGDYVATLRGDEIQLTNIENSDTGTAFYPLRTTATDPFVVRYWIFTGLGTGADGQCVSVGGNDLAGRAGEDGVSTGVAVCFDEWSNGGDDGVSIFFNGAVIWANTSPCENRAGCVPVSLFDDAAWHLVEVALVPQAGGIMKVSLDLDNGEYTGEATIDAFALPAPCYLGFTGRTGGATNFHWVRAVSIGIRTTVVLPTPTIPSPPSQRVAPTQFTLGGDATLDQQVMQLTGVSTGQHGQAWFGVDMDELDRIHVQFSMYTGDGTGADGVCVNIGANDLAGRAEEDGVAAGLALCFDEYANDGDHGITIFYNGASIWEELAACGNREGCSPVSLFEDSTWHTIDLTITPSLDGGSAQVAFSIDGAHHAYGDIDRYALPENVFLGFTARTGGATNNHWIRGVAISAPGDIDLPSSGASCTVAELGAVTANDCPAAAPGSVVPSTCPPGCAALITPWFTECRRNADFVALDASLGKALTRYNKLCVRSAGGGH